MVGAFAQTFWYVNRARSVPHCKLYSNSRLLSKAKEGNCGLVGEKKT